MNKIKIILATQIIKIRNYLYEIGLIQQYYFGACYCGKTSGYFNIGRNHWFCCNDCKTRWCIGNNLFSSWRSESEDEWKENIERYKDYKEIEPLNDSLERLFENIFHKHGKS